MDSPDSIKIKTREHALKIINFEKKKMILLTNKHYESYLTAISYYIFQNKFERNYTNGKNYHKVKNNFRY